MTVFAERKDPLGNVAETATANIFMVRDGRQDSGGV